MKKLSLILITCLALFLTGCIKRDSMEDITIYTSVYPIEYITNRLYGENSEIYSIYPNGVFADVYTLNEKQMKDYSKGELFIFNGLSKEKDYLKSMIGYNENLKIIDATLSIEYSNSLEELWLDPSNALMIARNIKSGFNAYVNNHYLKNELESNYEQLKVDLSNLSAKLNLISSSVDDPTIVVSKDTFKFLEKYGFKVLSLEENGEANDKVINEVKNRISNGQTKHIFIFSNEQTSDTILSLIANTDVTTLSFHNLTNLSEVERNGKKDYISIMTENINLLKQELYK